MMLPGKLNRGKEKMILRQAGIVGSFFWFQSPADKAVRIGKRFKRRGRSPAPIHSKEPAHLTWNEIVDK